LWFENWKIVCFVLLDKIETKTEGWGLKKKKKLDKFGFVAFLT